MAEYRLFYLSGRRIQRAVKIVAQSDAAAVEQAVAQSDGQAVELWQGGRPIGLLGPGADAITAAPTDRL
jgi:hypothetical protein